MSAYNMLIENARERDARISPNPYGLTVREKNVAAWLGRGLDRDAIASKLAIGRGIVAGHITRIAGKLGARNATHLSLIINTLPGLPVEQPTLVAIEDFRVAFGMGWGTPAPASEVVFSD
jgi:DNA-binding CsgD family transcriptional regulator